MLGTYFARDASYAHEYTDVKLIDKVAKEDDSTTNDSSLLNDAAAADGVRDNCTEARVAEVTCENRVTEGLSVVGDGSDVKMIKVLPATDNNNNSGDVGRQQLRVMVAARVFVGRYTTGHRTYRKPPLLESTRPHSSSVSYDSCVNYIDDPTLFVIFDSSQCYPEYFITYSCASE